jgi:hypothetical protein
MLALTSEQWSHRADVDRGNPRLNLSDGRRINYEALLAEVGPRYVDVISGEALREKAIACDRALDRLAAELEAAAPDAVMIIGDDQGELFSASNQPAFAIFHGEEVAMHSGKYSLPTTPDWMRQVGREYMMDAIHRFPGCPALGLPLIEQLVDRGFDVGAVANVPEPEKQGFGHAYGFVVKRLLRRRPVPVLPLLVNTYFPPNVPSSARCYDIGQAIAASMAELPQDLRVAVVGSGGLSHFVVDEALDRRLLKAMQDKDAATLCSVPRAALQSGSSEILNWIMTAGAVEALPLKWSEYYPLYRTPAGTGTGAGFCVWRQPAD